MSHSMPDTDPGEVTQLLRLWHRDQPEARERVLQLVYEEMRRRARWNLRGEQPGDTLETTALVHEAYLRLVRKNRIEWRNKEHFLAIAAQAMRRILVDRARRRAAQKRIEPGDEVALEAVPELSAVDRSDPIDGIDLRLALDRLARVDRRLARLVGLRYFAGLSIAETADALGISTATVKRGWLLAQAWLRRAMHGGEQGSGRGRPRGEGAAIGSDQGGHRSFTRAPARIPATGDRTLRRTAAPARGDR